MEDLGTAARRLPAETTASGMPLIASICGTACAAAAIVVTVKGRFFFEHPVLGGVFAWAVAGGVGFAAAWGFGRWRGLHRRPLTRGPIVVALVLAVTGVWGVQTAASHVYMSPWARYVTELAGPGQCLAETPYGTKSASVVRMAAKGDDRMEVWPGGPLPKGRTYPVLRLRNAVLGGTHPLAPANEESKVLLSSYGC
ncbi:hypothetical protein M8Z33_42255 [Streptomyces sp. ZAF1911]|uniref:hypothetical protein n=1 Tax=Streptomyces sp. ZAF1911 TaxID=2944129 RepID=UPI00237B3264|nr:hypothetical protein [Streptomyces sp. ZAF1911]MDD9383163.1 hypothetical protein [Streptomyces sp. ZAF1911]